MSCPGSGGFWEGSSVAESPSTESDATTLGTILFEADESCESFWFDFVTAEGAPATSLPAVEVGHLASRQVIRVEIDVDSATIVDQLVDSVLVERLYVVRSLDGGIFVDLHLAEPAAGRITVESSPARLRLDLIPGAIPFEGEPSTSPNIVVVSPSDGDQVDRFTQIEGYAMDSDAEVTLIVTQGGGSVSTSSTSPRPNPGGWGEFRAAIGLPTGSSQVFVGEMKEDGGLEGIVVDVTAP